MIVILSHFFLFLALVYFNGTFFLKNIIQKNLNFNFFEISTIGLIVSLLIAQILNFFIPLNNFVIFSNLFFLIIFSLKNRFELYIIKKEFVVILIAFTIAMLNIYGSDFSDDIDHYHLSYIINTDNTNYIWGLNNLHPLYGTSPIWLIGHSYFNFEFSRLQDIHIFNGLIFFLFLGIFITELKSKKINNSYYFPILFSLLVFVLLKYTRLKEFGIDRPSYLFFFISIYFYFKYLKFEKKIEYKNYLLIYTLILLVIFFTKIIFIFFIIIPFFLFYKNINNKAYIKSILIIVLFLFSYFLKNILISGCFFYPVYFSCVDSIPWFESKNLFELTISAEIFNKSFPSYNGFLTSKEYIKNFVWLDTWFNRHKVEIVEFLAVTTLVLVLTLKSFKLSIKPTTNQNYFSFFTNCLIFIFFASTLIFFIKNPNIRMNHHILIILLLLLIIFFTLNKKILINKKFFLPILILSLCFNLMKNIQRISHLDYQNNYMKNIKHKIYIPKKNYIDNFEYFTGWIGGSPIGNQILKDKKFKKISIFKIIY